MNAEQGHREHADSVGAYALGALPDLEAQAFERHLMGCELCQDELRHLNEAVEALPRSVTPLEPPRSLKTSLMDVVNADAARQRPAREVRRLTLPRLRPAVAWAAVACLLAVGWAASELDGDDGGGAARQLAAEVDTRRVPHASASLSVSADDDGAVLRLDGMPEPGRARIYQVWVERDGEVQPVSIFDVDANGAGAAVVPGSLDGVTAVMVTREPRGGSRQPTETPVLRVDV